MRRTIEAFKVKLIAAQVNS